MQYRSSDILNSGALLEDFEPIVERSIVVG